MPGLEPAIDTIPDYASRIFRKCRWKCSNGAKAVYGNAIKTMLELD